MLRRFRRAYPDVHLQLRDMSTPEQVNALGERGIDIGFVRLPVSDDRLVMRPVLYGPLARGRRSRRVAGAAIGGAHASAWREVPRSAPARAAWNIAMAWHRDSGSVPLVQRFVGMVGTGRAAPAGTRQAAPQGSAVRRG